MTGRDAGTGPGTGPGTGGGPLDDPLFTRVAAGRISALIVDQIRVVLAEGRLRPGDRLPSERELAERFGVSRVTVRDALRVLEAQGLVEIRVGAGGGAVVTAPTTAVVGDGIANLLLLSTLTPEAVAEARLVMELGTVALAVERATDDDLAALRDVSRRSREALDQGRYSVELSGEFHGTLAAAAHNGAITLITETFRGPLSMHAVRAREPVDWSHEHSVAEHEALIDAIAARDRRRAQEVMAAHLSRSTAIRPEVAELIARRLAGG